MKMDGYARRRATPHRVKYSFCGQPIPLPVLNILAYSVDATRTRATRDFIFVIAIRRTMVQNHPLRNGERIRRGTVREKRRREIFEDKRFHRFFENIYVGIIILRLVDRSRSSYPSDYITTYSDRN